MNRKYISRISLFAVCIFAISFFASAALADSWKPSKPVTLIIPSKPGGGHDNNARVVAKIAEKYAGQPINIVNQSAGSGVVAYTKMMTAKPDGLTLGQMSIQVVSDQYCVAGAKYNQDSFKFICQISEDPNNLIVKADGPYGNMTLSQFIEFAKKNPGKIRIGVSGNWGNQDYTRYQIEKAAGIKFQRVSMKGGSNILMAILAGDLDTAVLYPSEIRSHYAAGEIKILAQNGAQRIDLWPEIPTFGEKGLDVNLSLWRVWGLPKETPEEIVNGWYEIMEKAMQDPELKANYMKVGIGYAFRDPQKTRKIINKAHDTYLQIIDEAQVPRVK